MIPICDAHTHMLFGIDDGAKNVGESIEMLKLASAQGVTDVFLTPHDVFTLDEYNSSFSLLLAKVNELSLGITLRQGCEIYCGRTFLGEVINEIKTRNRLPLGNSNYYLVEFDPYDEEEDILFCLEKLTDFLGVKVILAHAERCINLADNLESFRRIVDLGVKIQINAYSLVEEQNRIIKKSARALLSSKLVSFVGSDSHQLSHRPPIITSGVNYVVETCDPDYAKAVLYDNAKTLLF